MTGIFIEYIILFFYLMHFKSNSVFSDINTATIARKKTMKLLFFSLLNLLSVFLLILHLTFLGHSDR